MCTLVLHLQLVPTEHAALTCRRCMPRALRRRNTMNVLKLRQYALGSVVARVTRHRSCPRKRKRCSTCRSESSWYSAARQADKWLSESKHCSDGV
ncbi:hypothetical protein COO60DRAFT_1174816 [Scenedesmus sp. NREL 46B-D3]|nr:hypothetical protein COO60DRAFT_1174816 [Scenedesmus sp. NREL 46B-D3]